MSQNGKKLKLGGLGVSCSLEIDQNGNFTKQRSDIFGVAVWPSAPHMPPEIYDNTGYDQSVDIWALGVSLYKMCSRQFPYVPKSYLDRRSRAFREMIKSTQYPPLPDFYSDQLKQVVDMCLRKDSSLRPSVDTIIDLLEELQFSL